MGDSYQSIVDVEATADEAPRVVVPVIRGRRPQNTAPTPAGRSTGQVTHHIARQVRPATSQRTCHIPAPIDG
jgi:hypothetical protein